MSEEILEPFNSEVIPVLPKSMQALLMYKQGTIPATIAQVLNVDPEKLKSLINKYEKINADFESEEETLEIVPVIQNKNSGMNTYDLVENLHTQMLSIKEVLESYITDTGEGKTVTKGLRDWVTGWDSFQKSMQWIIERRIELNQLKQDEIYREEILKAISKVDLSLATKIKNAIHQKKLELGVDL